MYEKELQLQPHEFVKVNRHDEEMLSFIIGIQNSGRFFTRQDAMKKFGIKNNSVARRIRNLRKKGVIGQEQINQYDWVYYLKVSPDQIRMKTNYVSLSSRLFPEVISPPDLTPENDESDLNDDVGFVCDSPFECVGDFFRDSSKISVDYVDPSGGDFYCVGLDVTTMFNITRTDTSIDIDRSFNWDLYIKYNLELDKYVLDLFYDCKDRHEIDVRQVVVIEQLKLENKVEKVTSVERLKIRGWEESEFYKGYWETGLEQTNLMSKIYSDLKKAIADIEERGRKRAPTGRKKYPARPSSKLTSDDRSGVSAHPDGNYWLEKHKSRAKEDWTAWNVEFDMNERLKESGCSRRWSIKERSMAKTLLQRYGGEVIAEVIEFACENWDDLRSKHKFLYTKVPTIKCILGLDEFFIGMMDRKKEEENSPEKETERMWETYETLSDEEKARFGRSDKDVDWDNAHNAEYEWDDMYSVLMKEWKKKLGRELNWKDYEEIEEEVQRLKKLRKRRRRRQ